MSIETRLHAAPTIVIGFCIIMVGVALTLDRLQIMDAYAILRFWPVAIILIGGGIILQALWPPTDPQAVRVRPSGAPAVLLLLLIAGLLVGPRVSRGGRGSRSDDRDRLSSVAVLSGDRRATLSQQFRGGDVTVFMGGSDLDLRQAVLTTDEDPVLDVFAMMGGVTLRVPEGWTVDVRAVPVMGAVRDRRLSPGTGPESTDSFDTQGTGFRRGREYRLANRDSDRPAVPSPPTAGGAPAATPGSPAGAAPAATPAPPTQQGGARPPRLVVRGFIIMGGLDIRS